MRVAALIAVLLAAAALAGGATATGHRADEAIERRVDAIAAELRCPVCQNLSVKDSPSDVAAAFQSRIRQLVIAGKSDREIRDFFVARYGEWILLSPPRRGIGLAVWLAPALVLGAGLVAAGFAVRRWTLRARWLAAVAAERPEALARARAGLAHEESLARELDGLREQLDSGELEARDYEFLRERLAARAAVREVQRGRGGFRPKWRWPAAGLAAATIIVATLVPALRQRGAGDFPTGNDFTASAQLSSGIAEWQAAEQALDKGDLPRAVERYRLAVAFLPDSAELRARFGFALASAGRTEDALEQLRLAVRAAPSLPSARLYLGAVLLKAGKREAAAAHWRRFLELQPKGPAARLVRRALAAHRASDR